MKRFLSILLAALMLVGVIGAAAEGAGQGTPLVVATATLSQKFSPFYAETDCDMIVVTLTQMNMLTTDRTGGIIYNGIEGETHAYNGTDYTYSGTGDLSVNYDQDADLTTYTYRMREDLKFSDGVPATIDDVIFTYYVLLDPAYSGNNALNSCDIVGLQAYRTQISEASLGAVNDVIDAVRAAGPGYQVQQGDPFTQAAYDAYYGTLDALWAEDIQNTVDYAYENYGPDYAEETLGRSFEEIGQSEGLKVALGMALWGYGSLNDDMTVLTSSNGDEFDLADGQYPTIEDFVAATQEAYGYDFDSYAAAESAVGANSDPAVAALSEQIKQDMELDTGAGVPNIEGIRRVDDYTVEVTTHGFEAPAVYYVLGQQIAPLHYYGDPGQYDYENNRFGHPFGDLSLIQSKGDAPMGGGPYRFVKYENRVVYYEANEYYWNGEPSIKSFQYKETQDAEVPTAVQTGAADGGEMPGSKANFEMLRSFNSNGELTGDVVTTYSVAQLGYGYIGMNAETMSVAGEPGSEASKNLRRGFATLLAVYRDTSVDSYYGDAAAIINYPISTTSWAAPQATDEGYRVAFSLDVDGNDIYTADMTQDQKYDAALQAAVGFFRAAGYTFDEASGKFTAAPEGARLSYEVFIPGDGTGDHPVFALLTDVKNALDGIGFELKINDPVDSNAMWDALNAGTQDMWCAAWVATIDPDMYSVYHSSNILGRGGTNINYYHIQSDDLDQLIVDARSSADQDYRKQVYRAALDEIIDWAVEVPSYQRQNIVIASTERVDIPTVTPDVTTFYGWLTEVENMKMVQGAK